MDGAEGSGLMCAMPSTKRGDANDGSVSNSAISSSVKGSNGDGVSTLGLVVVGMGLGGSETLLTEGGRGISSGRLLTEGGKGTSSGRSSDTMEGVSGRGA